MKPSESGRRQSLSAVIVTGILTTLPLHPSAASLPVPVPTSALGTIRAIGITDGALPVYVTTASGLYRSESPTLTLWTKQSARTDIWNIAPDPTAPNNLILSADGGLYRSTDGGRSTTRVMPCPASYLVRSPSAPSTAYAEVLTGYCKRAVSTMAALYRSSDDGITWTVVVTDSLPFDAIVIDPANPDHLLMLQTYTDNAGAAVSGALWQSFDGGRTRSDAEPLPPWNGDLPGNPTAALISPKRSSELWVIWRTIRHSTDYGHSWHVLPTEPPFDRTALVSDPLTGRVYIASRPETGYAYPTVRTTIYTVDPDGAFESTDITADDHSTNGGGQTPMAITRNGYLLVTGQPGPLVVRALIGPQTWEVAPPLAYVVASPAGQQLGDTLSPSTSCGSALCQYFTKGALARGRDGRVVPVALVPRLLGAQVPLPVGGSTSTLTYRALYDLHSHRTPLPAGFHGGTLAVPGGTFAPYSPTLSAASGYVVPSYFWRYLTDPRVAPDGWLRDIGLPLTPAIPATVTKGKMGVRHITVQAFQNAVLTYDPQNAAPFRVERANIGVDYAAAFPQAVR